MFQKISKKLQACGLFLITLFKIYFIVVICLRTDEYFKNTCKKSWQCLFSQKVTENLEMLFSEITCI